MVIANRPRSIGPIYKGKPFGYAGGGRPGIIFFNDEGTENGGLTLRGERAADGKYQASTHMSFDQFDQDQIVVLNYSDDNGNRQAGLTFSDRTDRPIIEFVHEMDSINKLPDGAAKTEALRQLRQPIRNGVVQAAPRVFIGRDRTKASAASPVRSHGTSATHSARRLTRRTGSRIPRTTRGGSSSRLPQGR